MQIAVNSLWIFSDVFVIGLAVKTVLGLKTIHDNNVSSPVEHEVNSLCFIVTPPSVPNNPFVTCYQNDLRYLVGLLIFSNLPGGNVYRNACRQYVASVSTHGCYAILLLTQIEAESNRISVHLCRSIGILTFWRLGDYGFKVVGWIFRSNSSLRCGEALKTQKIGGGSGKYLQECTMVAIAGGVSAVVSEPYSDTV